MLLFLVRFIKLESSPCQVSFMTRKQTKINVEKTLDKAYKKL